MKNSRADSTNIALGFASVAKLHSFDRDFESSTALARALSSKTMNLSLNMTVCSEHCTEQKFCLLKSTTE